MEQSIEAMYEGITSTNKLGHQLAIQGRHTGNIEGQYPIAVVLRGVCSLFLCSRATIAIVDSHVLDRLR